MTDRDDALGMVGATMTMMFGITMVKYAQDSTRDLMKQGRGKAVKKIPFDPYGKF